MMSWLSLVFPAIFVVFCLSNTSAEHVSCYICSYSRTESDRPDFCTPSNFIKSTRTHPCSKGCETVTIYDNNGKLKFFYRNCADKRNSEANGCHNVTSETSTMERCTCNTNECNGSPVQDEEHVELDTVKYIGGPWDQEPPPAENKTPSLRVPTIAPSVRRVPDNGVIEVKKGEPAFLACYVAGNPLPVVTWSREDGKTFPDGQKTIIGQNITFIKTNRQHSGVYICTAENSVGSPARETINLEVSYEPEVEMEQSLLSLGEGYNSKMTCTVHGEPKPIVSWYKNGEELSEHVDDDDEANDHRYIISSVGSNHVLSIDNVRSQDFANYTCQGQNQLGRNEETIEMNATTLMNYHPELKNLSDDVEMVMTGSGDKAICPFIVVNRVRTLLKGALQVNYTEVVCSGECEECTRLGRSCKQLKSKLKMTTYNLETLRPEQVEINAHIGCACLP